MTNSLRRPSHQQQLVSTWYNNTPCQPFSQHINIHDLIRQRKNSVTTIHKFITTQQVNYWHIRSAVHHRTSESKSDRALGWDNLFQLSYNLALISTQSIAAIAAIAQEHQSSIWRWYSTVDRLGMWDQGLRFAFLCRPRSYAIFHRFEKEYICVLNGASRSAAAF